VKTRCRELIEIGDRLFSKRYPILTLWQTFAENFNPMRADFTRVRYISEEFASYLMTGRPVLAQRELTNGISTILRPRGLQWFKPGVEDEAINTDPQCMQFFDFVAKKMRSVQNDRRSQFRRATKEGDGDFILFGQAVIESRPNAQKNGMLWRDWHLRDCVWTENANLVIDGFHRKWQLEARQLVALAKESKWTALHPDVAKTAEKDPGAPQNLRVVVVPTEEYDSFGTDENGDKRQRNRALPFVNVVIDQEHETILEETPQHWLGYNIPRWVTIGGFSQYAYAPTAVVALPDGRMLQQMTLTLLEIGSKIVDPPMVAVGDVIQGGTNLYAGAITWLDPDYDERTGEALRPITINGNGLQWGTEYVEKIEKVIDEAFFLNALNLPEYDSKEMTAEEWRGRMQEYIRRATPLFEPMDVEYNGTLCDSQFEDMMRMGQFGSPLDIPQKLRGQEIKWIFNNPLVAAEEEQKTTSFTKLSQLIGAAMQIQPDVVADVDYDTAFRDAIPGTGSPAKWVRPLDQANAAKAQSRQAAQAAQNAQQLGAVAEHGGKLANAVGNVADAAKSLQDAGMT
jgi:hypothetical protein